MINMASKNFKDTLLSFWNSFKPFLIFLLIIYSLIGIAIGIYAIVWLYDTKDITLIIFSIIYLTIMGIFVIGFMAVGFKYIISLFIEKEEEKCIYCGKTLKVHIKFCPECGNELR
jgi:hypothetical protein